MYPLREQEKSLYESEELYGGASDLVAYIGNLSSFNNTIFMPCNDINQATLVRHVALNGNHFGGYFNLTCRSRSKLIFEYAMNALSVELGYVLTIGKCYRFFGFLACH